MESIDTLIRARWIAPMHGQERVLTDHAVAIRHGVIEAICPIETADARYQADEIVDLSTDHLLIPGLINAHTHAAMNPMRGIANDKPLMPWLTEHIWPIESAEMSQAYVSDGVDLAMAEMIRCGTTCFNDMYFFPDVAAARIDAAGMRATLGMIVIDFPSVWAAEPAEYLDKGLALRDAWRHHDRISTVFAPHAPYTVSDEPLRKVRTYADEMELRVHMHVHETVDEVDDSCDKHGMRPLARLDALGLVNPGLLAVHMTQITDDEIARCAAAGIHVVHSPESNLKLASGLCPVQKLLDAGINVALGTDSVASNNDLDMLGEMRTAALIGKVAANDAAAIPADTALAMATINGARALGIDDRTGSLAPGKMADLAAIDLSDLETRPVFDPIGALVYSATRDQVTDTWVDGRPLMRDRRLTTLDAADLSRSVDAWQQRLARYAPSADGRSV
ncbi:TRZ/ATZ family hydrolase [Salinisphaera sp. Q1T1-3]|uniref:TRZ/ATZ family hydrolase n=1 Tax=Salinisphaera sp. Q1T1-3 TaxID=2321229 RepID=UPI000E714128|nr:TRZ/ATZ family hydrolase [Salinisphaera sp. Q1T1-3]RJS92689.1 TRZ/ATZ family hydrolase [Salinisphaera sp. Q1T1-3]